MKIFAYFSGENPAEPLVYPDSVTLLPYRPLYIPDFADSFVAIPMAAVKINRLGKCIAPKFASRYYSEAAPAIAVLPRNVWDTIANGHTPAPTDYIFDNALVVASFSPLQPESQADSEAGTAAVVRESIDSLDELPLSQLQYTMTVSAPEGPETKHETRQETMHETRQETMHETRQEAMHETRQEAMHLEANPEIFTDLVAQASRRNTLKMGDLILIPLQPSPSPLITHHSSLITPTSSLITPTSSLITPTSSLYQLSPGMRIQIFDGTPDSAHAKANLSTKFK